MRALTSAFVLVVSLGVGTAMSQPLPRQDPHTIIEYALPLIQTFPPLNSGMPLEVMAGYIIGDSAARTASRQAIYHFLQHLTYADTGKVGDTLRFGLKNYYMMKDFDPIRFLQWCSTQPNKGFYKTQVGTINTLGLRRLREIFKDDLLTYNILAADHILHIYVTDTVGMIDTGAALSKHGVKVTCDILDTIKGQTHIPCPNNNSLAHKPVDLPTLGCIEFEYKLEWPRYSTALDSDEGSPNEPTLFENGETWVQPGREYIVFLKYVPLGRDSNYNYMTLVPAMDASHTAGMYPIVSGVVENPFADFGLPVGTAPNAFKAAIRTRIDSILNPQP